MKHLITLLVMLSVLVLSIPAFAEIPHYIQFQGKATDDGGIPLDGTYKLTFRIYNVEAGEDPPVWSETHNVVEIEGGVFSVLLGEVNPLNIPFDKSYWISMEIGTIDCSNELPRQLISSVGYAYRAKTAATLDVQTQDLDMGGHKILNVVDPTADQHAATKKYIDDNFFHKQIFTADGTFVAPAGITKVFLTMVGGGAGGGGSNARTANSGGGGGGGASCIKVPYTVVAGNSYVIQVGVKGTGGAGSTGTGASDGTDGEDTIFDTAGGAFTVAGGNKGAGGTSGGAGAGGTGGEAASMNASGTTAGAILESAGGNGANGSGYNGGGGGGSIGGNGGAGGASAAGAAATGYGAGGGGAGKQEYAGGNGSDGIVIVEW